MYLYLSLFIDEVSESNFPVALAFYTAQSPQLLSSTTNHLDSQPCLDIMNYLLYSQTNQSGLPQPVHVFRLDFPYERINDYIM